MSERQGKRVLASVRIRVRVSRPSPSLAGGQQPDVRVIIAGMVVAFLAILLAMGKEVWPPGGADKNDERRAGEQAVMPTPSLTPTTPPTAVPSLTPTPLITPTPTQTPVPSTPEVLPIENPTVKVELYDREIGGEGGSIIVSIESGGRAVRSQEVAIKPAVQTIAGEWTPTNNRYGDGYDVEGAIEVPRRPGDYVLLAGNVCGIHNQYLRGTWGVLGADYSGKQIQLVPFPVRASKTTKITISLAQLDVGILSPEGRAVSEARVCAYCQETDIAGNPVSITDVDGCYDSCVCKKTDNTGLATIHLGAGTYTIGVKYFFSSAELPDVVLSPGEHRTEILTLKERY
jgi:hypothetical protein